MLPYVVLLTYFGDVHNMLTLLHQITIALVLIGGTLAGPATRVAPESSSVLDSSHSNYEGMAINSVHIDNRNIFDTNDPEFDRFLFRMANRFHWTTREDVVRREVLQGAGDKYSVDLAEETARNLRHRLQLYDAWVEVEESSDSGLVMRVVTIDQWSTSAVVVAEHVGDISRYRFGPAERNLFGQNYYFTAQYAHESDEGDYAIGGFVGDRLRGLPVRLVATYSGNPKGGVKRIDLTHPYYDLAQSWRYGVVFQKLVVRRDIYSDSELIGSSQNKEDGAHCDIGFRTDVGEHKLSTVLEYTYNFARVSDRRIATGVNPEEVMERFPDDSLYHFVQVGIGTQGTNYVKLERVDGFGYTEDFLLGLSSRLKLGRAIDNGRTLFDEVGFGLSWRSFPGQTLISFSGEGRVQFENGRKGRRLFWATSRLYNLDLPITTIALGLDYAHDWTPEFSENLSLGGSRGGLRGFDERFRTGNRRLVGHFEGRLFFGVEILSTHLGGVVFADVGRTWKQGEAFELSDLYGTAGIGTRISFERASRGAMVSIDLGYSERVGWQLSVGSGQFFDALAGILPLTTY